MVIKTEPHQITVKSNPVARWTGAIAFIMGCGGSVLLIHMLRDAFSSGENFTAVDFLIIFAIFAWIAAVFSFGAFAFHTGTKKLIIDKNGVVCRSMSSQNRLSWNEIKDYGLSYYNRTRNGNNVYSFYYAVSEQPIKSDCRKKLKGKMIKIYIAGDTYEEIVRDVLPFCRRYTEVLPFVAKDKPHFL